MRKREGGGGPRIEKSHLSAGLMKFYFRSVLFTRVLDKHTFIPRDLNARRKVSFKWEFSGESTLPSFNYRMSYFFNTGN